MKMRLMLFIWKKSCSWPPVRSTFLKCNFSQFWPILTKLAIFHQWLVSVGIIFYTHCVYWNPHLMYIYIWLAGWLYKGCLKKTWPFQKPYFISRTGFVYAPFFSVVKRVKLKVHHPSHGWQARFLACWLSLW